jgi:hypothetical protein
VTVIVVQNHSTRVTDAQVDVATRACATQVRHDVAPEWGVKPVSVIHLANTAPVPAGAYVIGVFDNSDQADALGWHTKDGNAIYGKVFASPVLDNGGTVLQGQLPVATVLSHEVLEAYLDPRVQLWAQDNGGGLWAYEICDPVEDQAYEITVSGQKVSVSNFVTAAWFDSQSTGEELDHMGQLKTPFELSKGGYAVKAVHGKVAQVFGDHFPMWKLSGKEHQLARTARRKHSVPDGTS